MPLVRCPECALPAQVVDRFKLTSTDGPVEHVKVVCPDGHWFTPPLAAVEVVTRLPETEAA